MAGALAQVISDQMDTSGMMPAQTSQPSEPDMRQLSAMRAIAGRLESVVNDRVSQRQPLEQRWIEDLEQLHGRYDQTTLAKLISDERSRLFMNRTRQKTEAIASRLKDMLFPTDERNWAIEPTPVPRLTRSAQKAADQAEALKMQHAQAQQAANDNTDTAQQQQLDDNVAALAQQRSLVEEAAKSLKAQMQESRKRSDMMSEEIDDQLTECSYSLVMRDVIDSACKYGTGVCKGPITGDRVRRGWRPGQEQSGYQLEISQGEQPAFRFVDIWNFFPDMTVSDIRNGEGTFERHLYNRKQLRDCQNLAGFQKPALRRLIEGRPQTAVPSYLAQLRHITEEKPQVNSSDTYIVWEYCGPLEPEDMRTLIEALAPPALLKDFDVDPLTMCNAVVWFCQGEILKFALYPFDSGEVMYSIFNLVKDETSVFGYGMPWLIRDPQSAINGAWRTMMDNAGVSAGPQIVVDELNIEPADGDYKIRKMKVWKAKNGIPKENEPFRTYHIESHQGELASIITMAEQFLDDMSMVSPIAQGEQGAGVTKTAQGMSLLMNSTNVLFRGIVKNFDDDVTIPNLRRLYDYNMQFSDKEDIKGDYEVKARGSSVLLTRELQSTNLMTIAMNFGGHPIFGPMLKNRELLRKLFQSMMIPADEVMLSDEEIDQILAQAAASQPDPAKAAADAEMAKIAAQKDLMKDEFAGKKELAMIERETALMQIAAKGNITLEQLKAMLEGKKMDIDHKERALAVETAATMQRPANAPTGGGTL